jgi:hypothetical protein
MTHIITVFGFRIQYVCNKHLFNEPCDPPDAHRDALPTELLPLVKFQTSNSKFQTLLELWILRFLAFLPKGSANLNMVFKNTTQAPKLAPSPMGEGWGEG